MNALPDHIAFENIGDYMVCRVLAAHSPPPMQRVGKLVPREAGIAPASLLFKSSIVLTRPLERQAGLVRPTRRSGFVEQQGRANSSPILQRLICSLLKVICRRGIGCSVTTHTLVLSRAASEDLASTGTTERETPSGVEDATGATFTLPRGTDGKFNVAFNERTKPHVLCRVKYKIG